MSNRIRNFTIIAHVDHGKSTLADSILLLCGAISQREFKEQLLDSMDLERERGITIKAQVVQLNWNDYELNMIDTPGHSDFQYEVSRSLRACETSFLLVDATKGIEAQTISNFYKALDAGHFIIPVINKIDLATAQIDLCLEEFNNLGLDLDSVQKISAKTGQGVKELLQFLIDKGPSPQQNMYMSNYENFRGLVVDSWYDKFFGVVTLIRVFNGEIKTGDKIKLCSNNKSLNVLQVGVFKPKPEKCEKLVAGQLGYLITQVKDPSEVYVGDTLLSLNDMNSEIVLPGFSKPNQVVFCTFYPDDPDDSNKILDSLRKYKLNDSAFSFEMETSELYGMAFHCGFLGLLHLEVVKERLEREYEALVITTLPTVIYKVKSNDKEMMIRNVNDWPQKIDECEEPEAQCTIFTDQQYVGKVTGLCMSRRGEDLNINMQDNRIVITCKIPLAEIIVDFHDHLKSLTSGFASFEYSICGYRKSKLSRLLILINGELVKEFGVIVHVDKAKSVAKHMAEKLKDLIPRGQVKIKIQIAQDSIGKIIASEEISPYRKDVIAKCYGGDITRKKKLLEKQKKGKKNLLSKSNVIASIPNESLKELLKMDI